MWSGVRELALGSPGNLTIKVPNPALKRENMRSCMTKWCMGLSRNRDERFFCRHAPGDLETSRPPKNQELM